MFRHTSTVALIVFVAFGSSSLAVAEEAKEADNRPQSPSKELAVDLGKGVKLEMVLIPAGEFLMGSPDADQRARGNEKPQHRVRITKPFYLGKYPVTQEQWEAVMGNNPSSFKGPRNPVEMVSWNDCRLFFDKLNEKFARAHLGPVPQGEGKFGFPTEAQWEYACRAGSTTLYGFGDEEALLGEYAWYASNSEGRTHPVGEKKPNAWGLYDMHGNVWQWCADGYGDGYYGKSPKDDPPGVASGTFRILRGGSWILPAWHCRSAYRSHDKPDTSYVVVGVRAAMALVGKP